MSQQARKEMQACANECVKKVLEQVSEKRLEEKLRPELFFVFK